MNTAQNILSYFTEKELFVSQKVSGSTYDSEFKFLGKELDRETGYTKTDNRYYWANAGIFLSVDPLCDERPWITPFNYAQNNPIGRKDPTGLLDDWYETKDKQVVYSESIRSQKDLDAAGIDGKYIGITGYTSDKQQYLSLFGEKFNTKNADGQTNLKAEMVKNLDNAIINMYKAEYKNQNRQGLDSEVYLGETNMFVKNLTRSDAANYRNFKQFDYAGGRVTYHMSSDATNGVFTWGKGNITQPTGYFQSLSKGVYAIVYRNNAKFRVVDWGFKSIDDWKTARNKAHDLLNNRKW